MDLLSSAASPEEAGPALVELLGVDHVAARAIMELQLRRFTVSTRTQIESELRALRRELGAAEQVG